MIRAQCTTPGDDGTINVAGIAIRFSAVILFVPSFHPAQGTDLASD